MCSGKHQAQGHANRLEPPSPPDGYHAKVLQVLVHQIWHNLQGDFVLDYLVRNVGEPWLLRKLVRSEGMVGAAMTSPRHMRASLSAAMVCLKLQIICLTGNIESEQTLLLSQ